MTKSNIYTIAGILLILLGVIGATAVVRGAGPERIEDREVSSFTEIVVNGNARVTLHNGDTPGVTVRAGEHVLPQVKTEVSGGVLTLEVERKGILSWFGNWSPVEYAITTDLLERIVMNGSVNTRSPDLWTAEAMHIEINGSGQIELSTVTDSLDFELAGSGKGIFSGSANQQRIVISGSGTVESKRLNSRVASVRISGSGTVDLHAREGLDVEISGSGKVGYLGDPLVSQEVSGSGQVAALEEDLPDGTQIADPVPTDENIAIVEELDVLVMESFPVQVSAVVKGNLPDGCTLIEEIESTREENRFEVLVRTSRESQQICTQALVPFEEVVSLEVLDLPAGEYLVVSRGASASFTLDTDNTLPVEQE